MNQKILLFVILILIGCSNTGQINVTTLEIVKGNPTQFRFNLSHSFEKQRYCYSNITLFDQEKVISQKTEYLGEFTPIQVKEQTVLLNLPSNKTDYQLDINCFEQKITTS